MRTLVEVIARDKNNNLKKDIKSVFKKDGVDVTVSKTTYDVVLVGTVEEVYTGVESNWHGPRTAIKLAGETTIDPVYNIPVVEDPVYVNFDSSDGQFPNTRAEDAERMNIKAGATVIIRGQKEVTVYEDGTEYVGYSGWKVQYPSSNPIELRKHNLWVCPCVAVQKRDALTVYLNLWDKSNGAYRVKVKALPKEGNYEDIADKFAKRPNSKGELKNPQAILVVDANDYKLEYKNGKAISGEIRFSAYEILSKENSETAEAVTEEVTEVTA